MHLMVKGLAKLGLRLVCGVEGPWANCVYVRWPESGDTCAIVATASVIESTYEDEAMS